jgi:hypothetical protein
MMQPHTVLFPVLPAIGADLIKRRRKALQRASQPLRLF